MDTCVRNELYDEALNLIGFASTLERRHVVTETDGSISHGNNIISSLVADIRSYGVAMREQLFSALKNGKI